MADKREPHRTTYTSARRTDGRSYREQVQITRWWSHDDLAGTTEARSAKVDLSVEVKKSRSKQAKRIKREVRSRIGLISVLPYLTFGPIFVNLFSGHFMSLIFSGGALACFAYGLFELRLGLGVEADEAVAESESLPPPQNVSGPHKVIGLGLVALGMASFALAGAQPLMTALGIGGISLAAGTLAIGTHGLFGRAPRQPVRSGEQERDLEDSPLGAALVAANDKVHALYEASLRIADEGLRAQVLSVHEAALAVIDELYEDSSDLPKARRFLVTYLDAGVRLVSDFAKQSRRFYSTEVDDKFRNTMITMEQTFAAQLKKLRADDTMDLDIQMDVLDAQMKGEGVN